MATPRIGYTLDQSVPAAQQKAVSFTAPLLRPVRFTEAQVKDVTILAKQLSDLHQEVADTTQRTRSHPIQAPIIYSNVTVTDDSSIKIPFGHNLGRFAYFTVIGWRGDGVTAGPGLVSDQLDATGAKTNSNTLYLRSSVAGTADIMVF